MLKVTGILGGGVNLRYRAVTVIFTDFKKSCFFSVKVESVHPNSQNRYMIFYIRYVEVTPYMFVERSIRNMHIANAGSNDHRVVLEYSAAFWDPYAPWSWNIYLHLP